MEYKWRRWVIIIIVLLLVFGISSLFVVNGVQKISDIVTNNKILCNVYYFTQIVASLAVIVGGLVGVWQYSLTAKAERSKMNTECIQRAIDLAEYYKNNILKKYIVVQYVYEQSGLMQIANKVKRSSIIEFDRTELYDLLTASDIEEIERIRNSDEFIKAVLQADKIYDMKLDIEKIAQVIRDDAKKEVTIKIDKALIIQKFMGNIVTEILNNLEFFAMHFAHGTADETVVYQSLNQTYLSIVYILYYNIAILNTIEDSKYYTNVIELYKRWDNRNQQEKQDKIKTARNYTSKGNVVGKI